MYRKNKIAIEMLLIIGSTFFKQYWLVAFIGGALLMDVYELIEKKNKVKVKVEKDDNRRIK